jgi:hypothetical protein
MPLGSDNTFRHGTNSGEELWVELKRPSRPTSEAARACATATCVQLGGCIETVPPGSVTMGHQRRWAQVGCVVLRTL